MAADRVVWAGLDYSLAQLIGPDNAADPYGFSAPRVESPPIAERWNLLFLDERIDRLPSMLGRPVAVDIGGVTERNSASTNQTVLGIPVPDAEKNPHVSLTDVAKEVRTYELTETNGIALVFIVDKLIRRYDVSPGPKHRGHVVKESGRAAIYTVFFDISTRKVLSAERTIHSAGGGNFRNYWFRPIKDAFSDLKKHRAG